MSDTNRNIFDAATIKQSASGRWPEILRNVGGLDDCQLTDNHQPCPACGGTDRYRFDDKTGDGDHFCNQCGAGDGLSLMQKVTGWDFPTALRCVAEYLGLSTESNYTPPTPEQLAKRKADINATNAERKRQEEEKHAKAALLALDVLRASTPVKNDHPRLMAKGVHAVPTLLEIDTGKANQMIGYELKSSGVKLEGRSLVAAVKVPGESVDALSTLEFIDEKGRKTALFGGRKLDGYWAAQRLPEGDGEGLTFCYCEGVTTTLTMKQAAECIGIASLTSNNLPSVAATFTKRYPKACHIVCGDTGNGQECAERAARENRCYLAIPIFTPDQIERFTQQHGKAPNDWNDWHQLEGLAAVQLAINQATPDQSQPKGENFTDLPFSGGDSGDGGDNKPEATNGAGLAQEETSPPAHSLVGTVGTDEEARGSQDKDNTPQGFLLRLTGKNPGLYWLDPEGKAPPYRICSPLKVIARTRDNDGKSWGRFLEWHDAEGRCHHWAMPASMTCGDGLELAKALVDSGLDLTSTRKAREKLAAYLMESTGKGFVRCTGRTGWHGDAFVLPNEVIAPDDAEKVFLQAERDESLGMAQAGSLNEWRDCVAALASGNSRLLFAVSLAFAAPLAELAGESGGFHFVGPSSIGKTTIQLAAGSVWGNPQTYKIMWRATANGLEGVCSARNDLLLVLDDIGECEGKAAGEAAYMIANGQGKARSTRDGSARTPKRWRLLFVSSGEIGLSQHMAEAGKQIRAGQEVRMVDLPAGAGGDYGVFDVLTGGETTGAGLSERVGAMTAKYHGTAGRAFLRLAVEQRSAIAVAAKEAKARFIKDNVPHSPDGQISRAAGRFALVAFAGEIATAWGLTGWAEGEAWTAVERMFAEWIASRGGNGSTEAVRGISAVKAFLEAHGDSRFTPWDADELTAQKTINRVGFRKKEDGGQWFYVLPEAYQRDVCRGFDYKQVSEEMRAKGMLSVSGDMTGSGKAKRYTTQARLPNMGKTRCYLITPVIWEDE